jgi:hypothetical protein
VTGSVRAALENCDLAVSHLAIALNEFNSSAQDWTAEEDISYVVHLTRDIVEQLPPVLARLAERGLYTPPGAAAKLLSDYDPQMWALLSAGERLAAGKTQ